ncbi:unnamed protein product [Somion occarium]|uniref:Cytosine-specific methyltransferase n=1 Tax=Somion occarium TaxID=3059160 RepID=A0ABP1DEX8_9APHY
MAPVERSTYVCDLGDPRTFRPGRSLYVGAPLRRCRSLSLPSQLDETATLVLPGETTAGEDACGEIPVRLLTDFTIYHMGSMDIAPMSKLMDGVSGLTAKGRVKRWEEDSDEDEDRLTDNDEDEFYWINLTEIVEFDAHYVFDSEHDYVYLNPKIYIRTAHAWYILALPSDIYLPAFEDYWIRHRIFHLVISKALSNPRISQQSFAAYMEAPEQPFNLLARSVIGRDLVKQDLTSKGTMVYFIHKFSTVLQKYTRIKKILKDVPLVQSMLASNNALAPSAPVVTPRVKQIAQTLFIHTLHSVGTTEGEHHLNSTLEKSHAVHEDNPKSIHWVLSSRTVPNHYTAVVIDGVTYKAGDPIIVEKGEDEHTNREINAHAGWSTNTLANTKWFAVICYFFQRGKKQYAHCQWYQHGSQTLLQETAHPNGLFLIDECDNIELDAIYSKCNVLQLGATDDQSGFIPSDNDNNFFSGSWWNETQAAFIEPSETEIQLALQTCKFWQKCIPCGRKRLHQSRSQWTKLPGGGLSHYGVHYHPGDAVYLRFSSCHNKLYDIGQIVNFYSSSRCKGSFTADIRLFGRQDAIVKAQAEKRGKKTRMANEIKEDVDVSCIEGKAFVYHPDFIPSKLQDSWLQHPDHFICNLHAPSLKIKTIQDLDAIDLPKCKSCLNSHLLSQEEQTTLLSQNGTIRCLELFAGAGGLSTGLEMSGFVETKWAVEVNPSAALSYQANHPETLVYNHSSNLLLKYAMDTFEGRNSKPLFSLHKEPEELPPMPMPGEVDFICGGPPCQSFSRMNHHRSSNDIRSSLVANMLSYVELYRPRYFLLENVEGFLSLKGDEVQMFAVKFVLRALLDLGYQVHFKLLQAGQHGAPQGRLRAIFWGAKRDIPLPQFPIPVYCYPKGVHNVSLSNKLKLYPASREHPDGDANGNVTYHQCAPLPFRTVNDAIGDLPKFDWIDPHETYPLTAKDRQEIASREQQGIIQFSAVTDKEGGPYSGFHQPEEYPCGPLTSYQAWSRQDGSKTVRYHYTKQFGAMVVERTVNVPMIPEACHEDLPKALKIHRAIGKSDYRTLFGRLDGNKAFRTVMTVVNPNQKGGHILHPSQKRILTVREYARCQGFPDSYKLLSETTGTAAINDQYKQIGNAVPVPLALALGRELGKSLVSYWKKLNEQKEQEREQSPEVDMDETSDVGSAEY